MLPERGGRITSQSCPVHKQLLPSLHLILLVIIQYESNTFDGSHGEYHILVKGATEEKKL